MKISSQMSYSNTNITVNPHVNKAGAMLGVWGSLYTIHIGTLNLLLNQMFSGETFGIM